MSCQTGLIIFTTLLCITVDGSINRPLGGTKYYRAIYNYNPMMMSPNEGLEEEELRFHEGDIIKVCNPLAFNNKHVKLSSGIQLDCICEDLRDKTQTHNQNILVALYK